MLPLTDQPFLGAGAGGGLGGRRREKGSFVTWQALQEGNTCYAMADRYVQ